MARQLFLSYISTFFLEKFPQKKNGLMKFNECVPIGKLDPENIYFDGLFMILSALVAKLCPSATFAIYLYA